MNTPLTLNRLMAIREALTARLAGELDGTDGDHPQKHYEKALEWANEEIRWRAARKAANNQRD